MLYLLTQKDAQLSLGMTNSEFLILKSWFHFWDSILLMSKQLPSNERKQLILKVTMMQT